MSGRTKEEPWLERFGLTEEQFRALSDSRSAAVRADLWASYDPYPDIPPSLLNIADVVEYVSRTGMICPFHLDEERLKPASYAMNLLGPYIYWDETGKERRGEITEGEDFWLECDSIAFVTLEPELRLPDYMAMRFNLKIHHVYRGLLLGTGPLVDPGFRGRLSIPLHNLTTNRYRLVGGEALIWAEFTKLSPNKRWQKDPVLRVGNQEKLFVPFPDSRRENRTVADYVKEAAPHGSVRSSIPASVHTARNAAEKAQSWSRIQTLATIVALVFAIIPLWFTWWSVRSTEERAGQAVEQLDSLAAEVAAAKREAAQVRSERDSLEARVEALETR